MDHELIEFSPCCKKNIMPHWVELTWQMIKGLYIDAAGGQKSGGIESFTL